jgi:3-phenylpropionate/cinnamic acid dioxygenase small subunit
MADPDVDDLAARLQRLEDLDEIRRLYVQYGRHLDDADFDAYAELFARDAELRVSKTLRGDNREEIKAAMSAGLGGTAGRVAHVIGTPRIELDGDHATGECQWMAVVTGPDDRPVITGVGRHFDELVREDGRWRFARRRGHADIPAAMTVRTGNE